MEEETIGNVVEGNVCATKIRGTKNLEVMGQSIEGCLRVGDCEPNYWFNPIRTVKTPYDPGVVYTTSTVSTTSLRDINTLKDVKIYDDRIEVIYLESSSYWGVEPRVYKMIFTCGENGFLRSTKVYGQILPAVEESYTF